MEDLDTLVRRVDEDRWLASRFAPADVRARLIAIYAVNYEIAHVREVVREPTLAQIRLTWWRDAIDEVHAGQPARGHPALEAYAPVAPELAASPWTEIVEARVEDAARFSSWGALETYFERTAGAVLCLALLACGVSAEEALRVGRSGAQAWGYQGFLRTPELRARLPRDADEATARAKAAHGAARAQLASLPPLAFPAIGYLGLVPGYLRAAARGSNERPLLLRQLALIVASATGRI